MKSLAVKFAGGALVAILFFCTLAFAEEARTPTSDAITLHSLGDTAGRIKYEATAGTLPLINDKGDVAAKVFYTAYLRDPKETSRPITFVFNGGPGAAAAFLHLGALGPRVVNFTTNGAESVKPVQLADNPDNWLPFTDLVFVDPVGTGYSRAVPADESNARSFYNADKDTNSMADFVRLYLARNGRSLAPVFLVGESYGGFRGVMVAKRLMRDGVQVRGALLVSPALDFALLYGGENTLMAHALRLPSIAVAHAELTSGHDATLAFLPEVEKFAREGYLLHLAAGLRRDDAITEKLARYTGVAPEVIGKHHSRVSRRLFRQDFERRTDRAMSIYDAAITVPMPRPADDGSYDPILEGATTVFTPAMAYYAVTELKYQTDLPYHLLNRTVNSQWDFGLSRFGFPNAMDELEEARTQNPAFRVLIVHGYTDLVTPYEVSRYLVSQLKPLDGAAPVEVRTYRGGHMMYTRPASRHQLAIDANAFYQAALRGSIDK